MTRSQKTALVHVLIVVAYAFAVTLVVVFG